MILIAHTNLLKDYRKKITAVELLGIRFNREKVDGLMTGYRIVPRGEEEGKDEGEDGENDFKKNGGSTPGEHLNILMSLSTSLFIALTLF